MRNVVHQVNDVACLWAGWGGEYRHTILFKLDMHQCQHNSQFYSGTADGGVVWFALKKFLKICWQPRGITTKKSVETHTHKYPTWQEHYIYQSCRHTWTCLSDWCCLLRTYSILGCASSQSKSRQWNQSLWGQSNCLGLESGLGPTGSTPVESQNFFHTFNFNSS